MIFVLSRFIDNRFATSHLLRDFKEILQLASENESVCIRVLISIR